MTKAQELRDCSLEELQVKENDFRAERFTLINKGKQERKRPHLIRQRRRDVARIKTIRREKEQQQ